MYYKHVILKNVDLIFVPSLGIFSLMVVTRSGLITSLLTTALSIAIAKSF
jgi:hypothetical protein